MSSIIMPFLMPSLLLATGVQSEMATQQLAATIITQAAIPTFTTIVSAATTALQAPVSKVNNTDAENAAELRAIQPMITILVIPVVCIALLVFCLAFTFGRKSIGPVRSLRRRYW
ncbi:hypothetical protein G7Y89_g3633 [Cudoniella acicularis]|uniref:Uncharacterized protein n=1 Tax=Cudoniella acicularis TaxID=354080 RepID=A0A8H4RTZ8_9HELO|nr:hypothetical protein G7Y89_g3633 [Cudoniella acicularis]